MRVVFMGTPAFAVPSLRALLDAEFDVAAVCTQPDRPSGRGNRMTPCPVKALAVERDVPVLQFERIRRQEGLDALFALAPDLLVTAAFGQILSQRILDIPKHGTVNVHASLLPKYRGPAPINWCIINGETMTGVTTMMTDAGIDTGDILMRRETEIGPDETAGELSQRLSVLGADLLLETLHRIGMGNCPRVPQDHMRATSHSILSKELGRVDWTQHAARIENLVRGVNPWPGAYAEMTDGRTLKLWKARAVNGHGVPGSTLCADAKRGLVIACGDGALAITELQAPGARRMAASDYLLGHMPAFKEPS